MSRDESSPQKPASPGPEMDQTWAKVTTGEYRDDCPGDRNIVPTLDLAARAAESIYSRNRDAENTCTEREVLNTSVIKGEKSKSSVRAAETNQIWDLSMEINGKRSEPIVEYTLKADFKKFAEEINREIKREKAEKVKLEKNVEKNMKNIVKVEKRKATNDNILEDSESDRPNKARKLAQQEISRFINLAADKPKPVQTKTNLTNESFLDLDDTPGVDLNSTKLCENFNEKSFKNNYKTSSKSYFNKTKNVSNSSKKKGRQIKSGNISNYFAKINLPTHDHEKIETSSKSKTSEVNLVFNSRINSSSTSETALFSDKLKAKSENVARINSIVPVKDKSCDKSSVGGDSSEGVAQLRDLREGVAQQGWAGGRHSSLEGVAQSRVSSEGGAWRAWAGGRGQVRHSRGGTGQWRGGEGHSAPNVYGL